MRYLFLCILFCLGCNVEEVRQKPPVFNKGDIVSIKQSKELGIILTPFNLNGTWSYNVMFQNINLTLKEEEIVLHKYAVWRIDSQPELNSIPSDFQ